MTRPVFIALTAAGLAVALVSVACFRRRPVHQSVALIVSAALAGAAAMAWHLWWLAGLWLVMLGWGLAILATLASRRRP